MLKITASSLSSPALVLLQSDSFFLCQLVLICLKLLFFPLVNPRVLSWALYYFPEVILLDHCAPNMQVYLWFLVSLKVEQEAEPSAIRLLSCGTIFQIWSRGQTPALHLRVDLKLSFLIKHIVRALRALSLCCYRLRLLGHCCS